MLIFFSYFCLFVFRFFWFFVLFCFVFCLFVFVLFFLFSFVFFFLFCFLREYQQWQMPSLSLPNPTNPGASRSTPSIFMLLMLPVQIFGLLVDYQVAILSFWNIALFQVPSFGPGGSDMTSSEFWISMQFNVNLTVA